MKSRKRLSVHMSRRSLYTLSILISIYCCFIVDFKEQDGNVFHSFSIVVFGVGAVQAFV